MDGQNNNKKAADEGKEQMHSSQGVKNKTGITNPASPNPSPNPSNKQPKKKMKSEKRGSPVSSSSIIANRGSPERSTAVSTDTAGTMPTSNQAFSETAQTSETAATRTPPEYILQGLMDQKAK